MARKSPHFSSLPQASPDYLQYGCIAKETSLTIKEMPRNAAETRRMGTRYELGIGFTRIADAALAIIKIYISFKFHPLNLPQLGSSN